MRMNQYVLSLVEHRGSGCGPIRMRRLQQVSAFVNSGPSMFAHGGVSLQQEQDDKSKILKTCQRSEDCEERIKAKETEWIHFRWSNSGLVLKLAAKDLKSTLLPAD
ncbi:MAG: isocitrate lyase 1 [Watsoniomyces obsoletus]|nr:MAG: isocitrate lyase 1 [Watsoniomyces obsoletus]